MENKNDGNQRTPCVKNWVGVLDGGVSRIYPVETENYFSETEGRLVRISYNTGFTQSRVGMADFFLNHARTHPGTLTQATLWFEFISYLENEPTEINKFWEKFDAREAEKERMRAMSGTKFANFARELQVIAWASQFEELVPPLEPVAPEGEGWWYPNKCEGSKIALNVNAQTLQFLGRWVVHAVQNGGGSRRECGVRLPCWRSSREAPGNRPSRRIKPCPFNLI